MRTEQAGQGGRPLAGQVALVTGASSGIGAATARALAGAGATVVLVARRAERLAALCAELGPSAVAHPADVAVEEQARAAVAFAEGRCGKLDVLVNNAGIIRPGTVETQDPREWRATFELNVLAAMVLAQAAIPGMRARNGGHIVNISSNAAKIPGGAGQASYAASKYALTAFSSSLRKELGAAGIRVTLIEPGTTVTEVAESIPDPQRRAALDRHMHREHNLEAEDVAAAVLYAVTQPPRVNVNEIWLTPTRHP